MIASLVDCQLAHINTSHPEFVGGSKALRLAQAEVGKRRGGVPAGQENEDALEDSFAGAKSLRRRALGDASAETNKKSDLYSHEDGVVTLREPGGPSTSEPSTDEEMLQVIVNAFCSAVPSTARADGHRPRR